MEHDELQSYLYFGAAYRDLAVEGRELLADCDIGRYRAWAASASEDELVRQGIRCLREATREALGQRSESLQGVFLSGGFDSRAVLGCLLEHLDTSEIVALTFGTPGALDYEIPAQIARSSGIRHERLDATAISWDVHEVTTFAAKHLALPAPEIDGEFISYKLWGRLQQQTNFWTGYLGDAVGGANLPRTPSETWEQAITAFLRRNRQAWSTELTEPGWDVRTILPRDPLSDPDDVGLDDQIEFAGRQTFRIGSVRRTRRPIQLFQQPTWKSYMLSVPREHRYAGAPLYHRILEESFPKLFTFAVQGDNRVRSGLPTHRVLTAKARRRGKRLARRLSTGLAKRWDARDIQKLDYAALIRSESDYAVYVSAGLKGLSERAITDHIDIDALWSEHRAGIADHADALRILSSLEMNLRAHEAVDDDAWSGAEIA